MDGGAADLTDTELTQLQSHFIKTVLVLLFLGYPAISTKMLSVLNCREIHGAWYLQDGESVISVALAARRGCTATPTDARCSRGGGRSQTCASSARRPSIVSTRRWAR